MLPRRVAARNGLCWGTFSLVTALSVLAVSGETSFARSHHQQQHATSPSSSDSAGDEPRYSDIVVDGNTGTVLHASSPDGLRHPASLTKIMTLYLLFEQLEAGRLKLDSVLQVSEHAAEQSPTKLGLRDGQTIKVEDAIKGIVTRSANDAAVVVAENIAGDEESFAKLMTRKAQTLGMAHTVYRNASGLPSEEQVTTARDQALLGRAIQERFPRYYKYFSTRVFEFRGEEIGNHNRLLGSVEGVDGIKTGYIAASGFNLVTSVHRDNRFLLAVVFGGSSAGSRDERMRELIRENIAQASVQRTATMVADAESKPIESRIETKPEPKAETKSASKPAQAKLTTVPVTLTATKPDTKPETKPAPAFALASAESVPVALPAKPEAKAAPKQEAKEGKPAAYAVASASTVAVTLTSKSDPGASTTVQVPRWGSAASAPKVAPVVGSEDPIHPVPVRTVLVHAGSSVQTASIVPLELPAAPAAAEPAPAPAAAPATQSAPVAKPAVLPFPPPGTRPNAASGLPSTITTGSVAEPPPAAAPAAPAPAPVAAAAPVPAPAAPAPVAAVSAPPAAPAVTHVGWMIQVGAFPAEGEAKQRLSSVQTRASKYLASADAFTETVSKGDSVLYRARFAGLAKEQAEAACAFLKHNDVECMTVKN